MNLVRTFSPKFRALFFKSSKRAGETSPLLPLVTHLSVMDPSNSACESHIFGRASQRDIRGSVRHHKTFKEN